jgi:nucleotide-binding universal stress UspA family protein
MQAKPTREEHCMTQQPPFGNVLVGVDGTPTGLDAIALGARLCSRGGRLTLGNIVLTTSPTYRNFFATPVWSTRREMLERERDAIGVVAELTGMFAPSVGSGLHQLGTDCGADLLVVGSSSRGPVGRVLVGDDARGTVSGAVCPVAVAPHGYADQADEIKTVGVAYDGGADAAAELAVARELAAAHRARLLALTVVAPVPGALRRVRILEQAARDSLRQLEGVEGRVAVGAPPDELVAFGDELDLLVVGSRGRGPLRRLILGSTSLHLTREARCPLLVIPRSAVAEHVPGPTD